MSSLTPSHHPRLGGPCVSRDVAEKRIINEGDFDVPLPDPDKEGRILGPNGMLLHPVQYHIFMGI